MQPLDLPIVLADVARSPLDHGGGIFLSIAGLVAFVGVALAVAIVWSHRERE